MYIYLRKTNFSNTTTKKFVVSDLVEESQYKLIFFANNVSLYNNFINQIIKIKTKSVSSLHKISDFILFERITKLSNNKYVEICKSWYKILRLYQNEQSQKCLSLHIFIGKQFPDTCKCYK